MSERLRITKVVGFLDQVPIGDRSYFPIFLECETVPSDGGAPQSLLCRVLAATSGKWRGGEIVDAENKGTDWDGPDGRSYRYAKFDIPKEFRASGGGGGGFASSSQSSSGGGFSSAAPTASQTAPTATQGGGGGDRMDSMPEVPYVAYRAAMHTLVTDAVGIGVLAVKSLVPADKEWCDKCFQLVTDLAREQIRAGAPALTKMLRVGMPIVETASTETKAESQANGADNAGEGAWNG